MFLFDKKTKNVIKYIWGVLAVLIMFSMVIAFSGFTSLSQTAAPSEPIELTEEEILQLKLQGEESLTPGQQKALLDAMAGSSTSTREQAALDLLRTGKATINSNPESTTTPHFTEELMTPPEPALKFEI